MSAAGNGAAGILDRRAAGIGLRTPAMLLIPLVDGLARFLSGDYSPVYVSRCAIAQARCYHTPRLR